MKPKKKEWEVEIQPYGKDDPILKTYESACRENLKPNIVNFQLYEYDIGEKQK